MNAVGESGHGRTEPALSAWAPEVGGERRAEPNEEEGFLALTIRPCNCLLPLRRGVHVLQIMCAGKQPGLVLTIGSDPRAAGVKGMYTGTGGQ